MKKDYKYILYEISLKLLLRHKGRILILRTEEDYIDLPGGRIERGEGNTSLEKILDREIKEELGPNVQYIVDNPLFWYRGRSKYGFWIFGIIHTAKYLGGEIKLSQEHKSYEWIYARELDIKRSDFAPLDHEKYLVFKKYFKGQRVFY